jgi:hypothetical protein
MVIKVDDFVILDEGAEAHLFFPDEAGQVLLCNANDALVEVGNALLCVPLTDLRKVILCKVKQESIWYRIFGKEIGYITNCRIVTEVEGFDLSGERGVIECQFGKRKMNLPASVLEIKRLKEK